jgi:anti-sigma factor RsiW
MPPNEQDTHTTPEELSQYYASELSDDQAERLEDHLAACDHCMDLAATLQNFGALWDGWTAKAHGEALTSERVMALDRIRIALERAARRPAAFGGRLANWLQRLPRLPLSEILETAWRPGSAELEPVAILTHGEARPRDTVTVHLSREQWLASVSMPPDGWLDVVISGVAGQQPAPLAILTSASGESSPLLRQAVWNESASAWVAVLSGIPAGDYLVAIEP